MKIERLNDNQIRCTLNSKDLSDRHLRLSELAYGSDKANALFRDMIQQASAECDFEAEDTPLMIEAIPVSTDCLVLLITKCFDADELDTRFSCFTDAPDDDNAPAAPQPHEEKAYADEIISCFEHLSEILGDAKLLEAEIHDKNCDESEASILVRNLCKVYSFTSLNEVIRLASVLGGIYYGENTLYKDAYDGRYYLAVSLSEHTPQEFNKVCNILSEYGSSIRLSAAGTVYFDEHCEVIVRNKAIQILAKM